MSNELNVQAINEIALGTKRLMATVDGIIVRMDMIESEQNVVKEFMTRQEQINAHLATQITLRRGEQKKARAKTAIRIYTVLKLPENRNDWSDKDHMDYQACFGRFRARLYKDIHDKFDVSSYTEVPSEDAIKLYEFIDGWYPTEDVNDFKEWCYKQEEAKKEIKSQ